MTDDGTSIGAVDDTAFEAAADAVVAGDREQLLAWLDRDPALARAASSRGHRCTLLHYVAANGYDDRPQRATPETVAITRLLLARGAEPDALCAFGGEATPWNTPLVSVVTSWWMFEAGVHAAMVDALADGGAALDGLQDDGAPLEFALGFGYQGAAQALVRRGARIGHVVHAAGLGRLDLVRDAFDPAGALRSEHAVPSGRCTRRAGTPQEILDQAFVGACRHRHLDVAAFLLERGADLAAHGDQGFTPLHTAAWYGHDEVLEWLLAKQAPLEALQIYGGTVLDGTCWGAVNSRHPGVDHAAIIECLCEGGANVSAVSPFPTGNPDIDAILRRYGR